MDKVELIPAIKFKVSPEFIWVNAKTPFTKVVDAKNHTQVIAAANLHGGVRIITQDGKSLLAPITNTLNPYLILSRLIRANGRLPKNPFPVSFEALQGIGDGLGILDGAPDARMFVDPHT